MRRVGAVAQALQLVFLGWLAVVLAVTPIYDETLWTKQLWHKWKVDRSQFGISPSQENPRLLSIYGIKDTLHNSLDGPLPRHNKGPKDKTMDPDALDDDSFLPAAAMAVKCSVCQTLLARVWQRLVDDVLRGKLSVSVVPQFSVKYLTEACDMQVLELLQRKVIYRLEMDNQAMTFFVLRTRKSGTTPTPAEQAAVKMACRDLIAKDVSEFSKLLQTQLQAFKGAVDRLLLAYGVNPPTDFASAGSKVQTDATDSQGSSKALGDGSKAGSGDAAAADMQHEAVSEDGSGAVDVPALIQQSDIDASELAAAKQVLQHMVSKLLKALAGQLRKEARSPKGSDISGQHDDVDYDEHDDDDEEEEDEEPCKDLHPMCEQWANEGECDANPNYMVGNSRLKGHCRKACGICIPSKFSTPAELLASLPSLVKSVRQLNTALLEAVQSQGCTIKQACLSSGDDISTHGNVVSSKSRPGQTTSLQSFKGVPHGAGFVLGRPFWGEPEVVETAESKAVYERQLAAEKAEGSEASSLQEVQSHLAQLNITEFNDAWLALHSVVGLRTALAVLSVGSLHGDGGLGAVNLAKSTMQHAAVVHVCMQRRIATALGAELGGKLLRVHEEFFTYEFLYKNHTRHYHDEPRHSEKITEAWSLGSFARESIVVESLKGGQAVLEPLDLLPTHSSPLEHDEDEYADDDDDDSAAGGEKYPLMMEQRSWPYIKQVYSQGDVCELGNGKTAVRRTEVRIACSPDTRLHLLIREPDFCHYIFVIYSPALCKINQYKPLQVRTPGAKTV